jgi:SAM-dependent methyltransferase
LTGPVYLVNDVAPTNSPVDIAERGGLRPAGRFVPMKDYAAFAPEAIPAESLDLVTCFIGLHHAPPERLDGFVSSIARVLRPGGRFVLRDHDVRTPAMSAFVSLAHTVFNAGLGLPWEVNQQERRRFASVADWVRVVEAHGLRDGGLRLLQAHDPTDNTLLVFAKAARASAP